MFQHLFQHFCMIEVTFSLDNPKREVSTIRGFIRYAGKRYSFPTRESVKTACFSKGKCRECKEARAINNKLVAVEIAMKNAILYYKQDFKVPEAVDFRKKVEQFLTGNNAIEIKRKDNEFLSYVDEYIKTCDKSVETIKSYKTALNSLREFEKVKKKTFSFDDITLKFAEEYRKWLLDADYSRNYIGTLFKNLKFFMKHAREVGKLHDNTDYEKFKVEAEVADTIALSEIELLRLHRLVIDEDLVKRASNDERLHNIRARIRAWDNVRKKFLIGAFTAMRVSDFNRIQDYNIQDGIITILPKKGSSIRKPEPVKIPMHPVIQEILASGFDLSCKVSEQYLNKQIKVLCRLAGIVGDTVVYRTEGGVLKEFVKQRWELVSTHTARRSGATNFYKQGIPKRSIMLLTGHKSEKQFDAYVKLSAEENAKALMGNDYFNRDKADSSNEWMLRQIENENTFDIRE